MNAVVAGGKAVESTGLVECRVLRPTVSRPTVGGSQRDRLGASPQSEVQNPKPKTQFRDAKARAWAVRSGRVDASRRAAGSNPVSFRVFRRGNRRQRGCGPSKMGLMATVRDAGAGGAKSCTEKWAVLAPDRDRVADQVLAPQPSLFIRVQPRRMWLRGTGQLAWHSALGLAS